MLLLILFWLVMVAEPEKLQQQLILNIPIELHSKSGVPNVIDFYLFEGDDVNRTVSNFCISNNIEDTFCQILMKSVLEKLQIDGGSSATSSFPVVDCLAVDNICKQKTDFAKMGLQYGTDKITHHGYHRYYPRYLDYYRSMPGGSMIEIGIDRQKSLNMWLEYFPNAFIYGIDIVVAASGPRHKIFKTDQSNMIELENIVNNITHPVFFIIDDGSHVPEHQTASFNYLFSKKLMPGGVYIIEDIETSYWINNGIYGYSTNYGYRHSKSIIEIFKDLVDEVNNEFLNQQAKNSQNRRLGAELSLTSRSSISSITFGQNCIIVVKKTQEEEMYASREYRFSANV